MVDIIARQMAARANQVGAPTDEQVMASVSALADEGKLATGATAEQAAQIEQNAEDIQDLQTQAANTDAAVSKNTEDISEVSEFLSYIKNNYITPEMFGAVGDGVTDDTDALKRIADGNVLVFNDAEDFVIRNVSIIDNGTSYGNVLVGKNCDNVKIENVTITITSPHVKADGITSSVGNWAANLSGSRFFIDHINIDTSEAGIWGDGLHFGYLTDSVISNFYISSGDDCIALEMHEGGGTGYKNITSKNVFISNGVLNSKSASSIRMGFNNSGSRTQDEISDIYCDGIIFDNIICKSKYFFRYEFISNSTDVVPPLSKNITFSNVKYTNNTGVASGGYVYFHTSSVYGFEKWGFYDCSFAVSDEQTDKIYFFSFGNSIKTGDVKFHNCTFDFNKTIGFANIRMDTFTLDGCQVKTNGISVTNDSEADLYINNCIFTNYADSSVDNIITTAESTEKTARKFCFSNLVINNFKALVTTKISSVVVNCTNIIFNNDMNSFTYVGGEHHYCNIISNNKMLTTSQNMFIYIAASGTYTLDCSKYVYCKITPLGTSTADTEAILYRINDGVIVSSDRSAKTAILTAHGLSVSFSGKVLTITNANTSYNNAIIELYSQTNG